MKDAVLLILRVPSSDDDGVALMKVGDRVDVRPVPDDPDREQRIAERAFVYAKEHAKRVVALQILSSDLFHWGFNDTILPGPTKTRFIGYIREELLSWSHESTIMLEEMAQRSKIPLEIRKVETREPTSAALEEAEKGYDRIFMEKEKKRLFPIFKKTIEQQLRKGVSTPITSS
jgi:antitoxin component of RelBE/YafQ-DinJ toxin-antitoxin module